MTLLKGKHSMLRYLGFIGAMSATLQALIWIGMYISGIICFYIKCGIRQPANRFGKAFNNIYLNTAVAKHYPHFVSPIFLHILLWFFMVLSALWLFTSVGLIVDYHKWTNAKGLRKSSKRWIVVTIIVCALDLVLFVLFVVDLSMLKLGHIGASVRSTDDLGYEDMDNDMLRPHDSHGFDDFYDEDTSNRAQSTDSIVPHTSDLPVEPEVASEAPTTPALSFEERLHQIQANLARKHAEVDKKLKDILAEVQLIRATELGTYYNPLVQAKLDDLLKQLLDEEKLQAEEELKKKQLEAAKKAEEEQQSTTTVKDDEVKTEAAGNETEVSTAESKVDKRDIAPWRKEDHSGPDKEEADKEDNSSSTANFDEPTLPKEIDNFKQTVTNLDELEEVDSSVSDERNFDRLQRKFEDIAGPRNETKNFGNSLKNRPNFSVNSIDYNDLWRSTFNDEEYGIILKNDGPGTGWRKVTPMHEGSTTGTDVVLAPSAVLMTLAIRGYVLWTVNLATALMLLYLYITRPRRPTLLTRIQA